MVSQKQLRAFDWVLVPFGGFGTQVAAVVGECIHSNRLKVFKWRDNGRSFTASAIWVNKNDTGKVATNDKRLDRARREWAAAKNICIRYGKPAAR